MINKASRLWKLAAVITVQLVFIIITGCSQNFSGQPGVLRSNTDGEVSIDVEYLGHKDNLLSFNIAMNTHSVDLDQYDLAQLSELADGKGNKYTPIIWDSKPGGHHRNGILTFSRSASQAEPDTLILTIHNIAEIQERTFIWENI